MMRKDRVTVEKDVSYPAKIGDHWGQVVCLNVSSFTLWCYQDVKSAVKETMTIKAIKVVNKEDTRTAMMIHLCVLVNKINSFKLNCQKKDPKLPLEWVIYLLTMTEGSGVIQPNLNCLANSRWTQDWSRIWIGLMAGLCSNIKMILNSLTLNLFR